MNTKERKCFIITPIGEANSKIFRKAKGVIDSVIKPVLIENNFSDIKPAYEISESGMIGNQIIEHIMTDDLVVANLTNNNPNVMYELAVRHIIAKPIIHICENGTVLPFDIKDSRTIFYNDDMYGTEELKRSFNEYVINIDYSNEYVNNPILNGNHKLMDMYSHFKNGSDKADILLRLQAENLQVENFQKDFLKEIPELSITSLQKAGKVFLIYIRNFGNQSFIDLTFLLRKIGSRNGIKVIFFDDLKTSTSI